MFKPLLTLLILFLSLNAFAQVKLELTLKVNKEACIHETKYIDETSLFTFKDGSVSCTLKILSQNEWTITFDTKIIAIIEDKEHVIAKPTLTLTWGKENQFCCDCRKSPLPIKHYSISLRAFRVNRESLYLF